MSDTYTKLFRSITASSVWGEPHSTRSVWTTLLAHANARGCVYASVGGLARMANATREETEAALRSFLAPDPDSRTKDHEGRRIVEIDGGWLLLNHAKFAKVRDAEERRAYKREWDRANRPSGYARSDKSPTEVRQKSDSPTPPALTPTLSKSSRSKACPADAGRFADFWAVYPKREAKRDALKAWTTKGLDAQADAIIADVAKRKAEHGTWLDGYVPLPATYLRGERWQDEITPRKSNGNGQHAPSRGMTALQILERMKPHADERLVLDGNPDRPAKALPPPPGQRPRTG